MHSWKSDTEKLNDEQLVNYTCTSLLKLQDLIACCRAQTLTANREFVRPL